MTGHQEKKLHNIYSSLKSTSPIWDTLYCCCLYLFSEFNFIITGTGCHSSARIQPFASPRRRSRDVLFATFGDCLADSNAKLETLKTLMSLLLLLYLEFLKPLIYVTSNGGTMINYRIQKSGTANPTIGHVAHFPM